jgi:hypothetical protein
MDAERRGWLETLAATCERILADDAEGHDPGVRAVLDDVANLLRRLRAELGSDLRGSDPG